MGEFKEVKGDLIKMAQEGVFDVIAHGVNCFCVQGAGLAPQMVKAFQTNNPLYYNLEDLFYKGDINKLGCIDYYTHYLLNGVPQFDQPRNNYTNSKKYKELIVINAYTQYNYGRNHIDGDQNPLDYEALTLCMRKINKIFLNKHIGLPLLGAGLARGNWDRIKKIIQSELTNMNVTIVHYNKE